MSMSGAVTINTIAVHKTLDCFGVPYDEDRLSLISKVLEIAGVAIKTQSSDSKKNAARKPSRRRR